MKNPPTSIPGVTAQSATTQRTRYVIDDIDIKDIDNTMADFQDQAMCLAQAIERHLAPKPGEDSPHFSAWKLCEVLVAHLEAGHMQRLVKGYLESEVLT